MTLNKYGSRAKLSILIGDVDIAMLTDKYIDVRVMQIQDIVNEQDMYRLGIDIYNNWSGNQMIRFDRQSKLLESHYNAQLKELNIDRCYADNDYICLVQFKQ